jgi:nitronate monooxygenase
MILDRLTAPIILAPLAGGPSTPELAAAVSAAGGLGFLASGYLSPADLAERMNQCRRLGVQRLAVNVFCPSAPADARALGDYLQRLRSWADAAGAKLGEPRHSDDGWREKVELLCADPPAAVSFTFGCPPPDMVSALHAAGAEVWITVTSPAEAAQAQAAGADVLVAQGSEGGGHRGSFSDDDPPQYGLMPLLALVRSVSSLPVVAAGGIASAASVSAVLAAGARAAQVGTAFMLSPEAGTSPVHRRALQSDTPTVLTRAFTGRLARGIGNAFIAEHEPHAVSAYPDLHYVTAPMRADARRDGDAQRLNLWAGEAHQLAEELPAAEIVARLSRPGSGTAPS